MMYEVDAHAYDEVRYEEHRARLTGFCARCEEREALPDDDFCLECASDVEAELREAEERAA
jgi:hypothetical protein